MAVEDKEIVNQAKKFLRILEESADTATPGFADEVLLFCYRLRDQYRIARSRNPRFPGPTLNSLNEVLYQLESNPDQTFQRGEWRDLLKSFLEGIANRDIILVR